MADAVQIKLDTRRFESALLALYGATGRDMQELIREQARGFIKQVLLVTPPGGSVTGSEARARGNLRIEQDVRRVFRELKYEKWTNPDIKDAIRKRDTDRLRVLFEKIPQFAGMQILAAPTETLHAAAKNSLGAVPKNFRPSALVVDGVKGYVREEQKKVGRLASGWNAAASALGVKPPAWIARHGTSNGSISIQIKDPSFSITITNGIGHASKVADLQRRVQWALNIQANGTERRVKSIIEKNAKKVKLL